MPTDADEIKDLKKKISMYEMDGAARLFYALNRKANEMADLLNKQNLGSLQLDDKNDKTFERLKIVWNDAATIASAVKSLGEAAGIINQDEQSSSKPIYRKAISAESMADSIGELAGKKNVQ